MLSHSNTTCDAFMNCFSDKIETIHKNLTPNIGACGSFFSLYDASTRTAFSSFYLPTANEIAECVQKSKSTTCQLDPIPTHLVKFCLPSLLPLITQIIHSSLITGTIPSSFKVAAITPILKKPAADCNDPENLRPISNLPFLSKLLDKIVAQQVHTHLMENNLFEQFQSAYRPYHSTETALIKVTNDLLMLQIRDFYQYSLVVLLRRFGILYLKIYVIVLVLVFQFLNHVLKLIFLD